MASPKRLVNTAVALGLVTSGLIASASAAEAAGVPTCYTGVTGVLSNGKLINRTTKNTAITEEKTSASPLPVPVTNITWFGDENIDGGHVSHYAIYGASGQRPRDIDVTSLKDSPTTTVKAVHRYRNGLNARLVASSGSYFAYALDSSGNLEQWTRFGNDSGARWFGNPKVVARRMGSLKTLSWSSAARLDGVRKDILFGTTKSGALKQFQIPWRKPSAVKITTLRKTGFASYTGLSLSLCNRNYGYASIIAIDKRSNQARWYTLRNQYAPKSSNLVRRGLVGKGANWRLHATS